MLLTALMAVSACSQGNPVSRPTTGIDPSFVHGTDGSDTDRLAAAVVTGAQKYWAGAFPETFGGAPWRYLDGGFFSVDSTNTTGEPPPCSAGPQQVQGNAYFCGSVDAIVWDRAALLPVLREHYGDAAVLVVLAHEMGHAVQQRSGNDHSNQSLHTESMADCYAGSFARWVKDGHSANLRVDPAQLDGALRALIIFRDPVGTTQSATDSHGTAFDRVSAFQDGYRDGPPRCASVTDETAKLTNHPDEPGKSLDEIASSRDADSFFSDLVADHDGRWHAPDVRWSTDPAARCPGAGAPVAYCSRPPTIVADRDALAALNRDIGDHASATLLASRYAVAAQNALHQPVTGRRTACLTGAYTGSLRDRPGAALSARGLDEAVQSLLVGGGVARDAGRATALSGFDQVAAFRSGVSGGASACGE